MAYQALYRRYRPINFDDMIGQEHITTTIRNQILPQRFSAVQSTAQTHRAAIPVTNARPAKGFWTALYLTYRKLTPLQTTVSTI